MKFPSSLDRPTEPTHVRPSRHSWKLNWRANWSRIAVCLVAIAVVAGVALYGQMNPNTPGNWSPPSYGPDANAQMQMQDRQAKQKNFEAANIERRKQIADDSAKLLKLAADLKDEVDKTTKDTLSVSVIRKADEIEKLARAVKEKMKLTVGSN